MTTWEMLPDPLEAFSARFRKALALYAALKQQDHKLTGIYVTPAKCIVWIEEDAGHFLDGEFQKAHVDKAGVWHVMQREIEPGYFMRWKRLIALSKLGAVV